MGTFEALSNSKAEVLNTQDYNGENGVLNLAHNDKHKDGR